MNEDINESFLAQIENPTDNINIELSDEDDDEYEKETDLIDNYVEKDVFQIFHPQIKQINNQELQNLI